MIPGAGSGARQRLSAAQAPVLQRYRSRVTVVLQRVLPLTKPGRKVLRSWRLAAGTMDWTAGGVTGKQPLAPHLNWRSYSQASFRRMRLQGIACNAMQRHAARRTFLQNASIPSLLDAIGRNRVRVAALGCPPACALPQSGGGCLQHGETLLQTSGTPTPDFCPIPFCRPHFYPSNHLVTLPSWRQLWGIPLRTVSTACIC